MLGDFAILNVLPYNISIMKMLELLEKDKDRILTEMAKAQTPEKGAVVLENQLDKMILQYNDKCDSDRERDAAAYMTQALRLSFPLMDSIGETKIWERDAKGVAPKKNYALPIILLILGACLCLLGIVQNMPIISDLPVGESISGIQSSEKTRYLFSAIGIGVIFLAGILFAKPVKLGAKEQQVEIHVDGEKAYRALRNAVISMDQSLEEIQAAERWANREQAGTIEGKAVTQGEIDLFADLLTAAYSKDGEYALEKIEDLKYYLHRHQIDVTDYSKENERYFDIMPGKQSGTIRPALVSDGKLLKKGLASSGK